MFDVGMFELLLIMVMGLVVLGPERLPEAARLIGAWLSKAKRTMADIKTGVEREVHAHEMRERIKSELEKAGLSDLKEKFESKEAEFRQQLKEGEQALMQDCSGEPHPESSEKQLEHHSERHSEHSAKPNPEHKQSHDSLHEEAHASDDSYAHEAHHHEPYDDEEPYQHCDQQQSEPADSAQAQSVDAQAQHPQRGAT